MLVRRKRDRSVLVSAERNLVSNRLCSRIRGCAFSQCLPLVQQGGVNRTNQRGQPIDDRLNLVRHCIVGNNLLHATIGIRQITQQHALGTSHVVTRNKLRECHRVLNHLTDNRLRRNLKIPNPRIRLHIGCERRLQQMSQRHRPRYRFQCFHTFVILHALGLHCGDGLTLGYRTLGKEQWTRIIENRFHNGQNIKRI